MRTRIAPLGRRARLASDGCVPKPDCHQSRPSRPRVHPVAVAVLVATLAAAQVKSQDNMPYVRLLDAYARNDPAAAAATLATWPASRVKEAVRALDPQTARDHARAGVMLHTEASLVEAADQRESFHVEIARAFASRL